MKKKNQHTFQENLECIARLEGVPAEAIRYEIERVIRLGFLNPDPQIRARWGAIPCRGDLPTPEEVVEYLSAEIAKRNREKALCGKR